MQQCIQRLLGWRRGDKIEAERLARIAEQVQNLPTTSAIVEEKVMTGDPAPMEMKKQKPHPK